MLVFFLMNQIQDEHKVQVTMCSFICFSASKTVFDFVLVPIYNMRIDMLSRFWLIEMRMQPF